PVAIYIKAERGLAVGDVRQIVDWTFLADEPPRGLGLELQLLPLRYREATRGRHQCAIPEPAATRPMHDLVILCDALRCRGVPLRRRSAHQHRTGRGAGLLEGFVEIADRLGAV